MNPIISAILEIYAEQQRLAKLRGDKRFVTAFEEKSGFERTIMNRWRHRVCGANLSTVTAVANALGYRLVLEKIEESQPS